MDSSRAVGWGGGEEEKRQRKSNHMHVSLLALSM